MKRSMKKAVLGGTVVLSCAWSVTVPAARQAPSGRATAPSRPTGAAAERALLDQYCVTCHDDSLKTANLSLQNLDLNAAGDHPEVWERVIRKLRAGMMPPPGMPRPPLAKYEELRDWLEGQIDRTAAAHPNPGSVVLHRLNRTEYANAIRDLLDLEMRCFNHCCRRMMPPGVCDNVAGLFKSISPTLLEAYTTAATRIARTAVEASAKSPTEERPISPRETRRRRNTSKGCLSALGVE